MCICQTHTVFIARQSNEEGKKMHVKSSTQQLIYHTVLCCKHRSSHHHRHQSAVCIPFASGLIYLIFASFFHSICCLKLGISLEYLCCCYSFSGVFLFLCSLHAAMTVARTHKPGSHGNFNEIRFYDKLIGISVDPIKKKYIYTCTHACANE